MFMIADFQGIEFRSINRDTGMLEHYSWGTAEEQECTLEATTEDIARYAGKSTLSIADRVLLTILKRIPQ